jgi:tetratricopeptide (TPR) repeat protein
MDFKKLMIVSAGVFVVVAVLFFVFLKAGGEEVSPITKEAQQLVEQDKKEKAIELLLDNEKKLDKQGLALLEQLKTELYPVYLEEAEKAFQDEEYVLALEKYKKVLHLAPSKEDKKTIEDNIKELEKLADEILQLQEDYNQYMETFKSTIVDSNRLLTDFRSMLDQLEVGSISSADFVSHFKSEVDKSSTILSRLDNGLTVSNQQLLDIHKEVVDLMNRQHNLILSSLNLTDSNKSELTESFKGEYLSIKQTQISLIQKLNDFAETNHLEAVTMDNIEQTTDTPDFSQSEDTDEEKEDKGTEKQTEEVDSAKTESTKEQ